MTVDATRATGDRLVEHCRAGTTEQGLTELYDPAAVSVEATAAPGSDSREVAGLEGIRGKHAWWDSAMEVHEQKVEGPYLHGDDRFAVIFGFDATERASGNRIRMQEVGVYTVNDAGRIVREEFFYTM